MKRLLILTVLALTLSTASGCRVWNWFHRGDACDPCVSSAGTCGSGPVMSGNPGTIIVPQTSGARTMMPGQPQPFEVLPQPQG